MEKAITLQAHMHVGTEQAAAFSLLKKLPAAFAKANPGLKLSIKKTSAEGLHKRRARPRCRLFRADPYRPTKSDYGPERPGEGSVLGYGRCGPCASPWCQGNGGRRREHWSNPPPEIRCNPGSSRLHRPIHYGNYTPGRPACIYTHCSNR
jgi:hypothetical protein